MKCELIIKKGKKVKNGTINVRSTMETIAKAFQKHGWQIIYFEPITEIREEEDTIFLDIGVSNEII